MKACAKTMMLLGAGLVAGDQAVAKAICPQAMQAVYADMHDGDKKEITIDGTSLTIKPSGNDQTWVVKSVLDRSSCSASIDFNVPGKPGPPPVNLLATLWYAASATEGKTLWGFTDPSGTLADASAPLNRWVQIEPNAQPQKQPVCGDGKKAVAVYADMHDGDRKEITVEGTSLTIKPSGNNQTWVVHSTLDYDSCSASIDFNVPGKPGPPPVNLLATLLATATEEGTQRFEYEFTDPSGTLASKSTPLNHWVEISKEVPTDLFADDGSTCAKPGDCGYAYQACCAGMAAKGYPCGCHLSDGDGKSGADCGTCGTAYSVCCAGFKWKGIPCTCDIGAAGLGAVVV